MLNINGSTTVRELLTAHPDVFDVLVSYGMCRGCKESPPPVPLGHFSQKHCNGDLEKLIEQVQAVIHPDNVTG